MNGANGAIMGQIGKQNVAKAGSSAKDAVH